MIREVASALKIISFDVDETLVTRHYLDYVWNKAIPHLYAENTGVSIKEAEFFVLREYQRIGSADIRWYLPEFWFEHLHLDQDPMEVFRSHIDKIRFFPEVPSVLKSLGRKYDLIIASGIPSNLVEIMMKGFKIYFKNLFSPVTDLQKIKKTEEFYKMVCWTLGIKPSSIVHVGNDILHDFEIPRRIGMSSYLLDRKGEKTGEYIIRNLEEFEDCIILK